MSDPGGASEKEDEKDDEGLIKVEPDPTMKSIFGHIRLIKMEWDDATWEKDFNLTLHILNLIPIDTKNKSACKTLADIEQMRKIFKKIRLNYANYKFFWLAWGSNKKIKINDNCDIKSIAVTKPPRDKKNSSCCCDGEGNFNSNLLVIHKKFDIIKENIGLLNCLLKAKIYEKIVGDPGEDEWESSCADIVKKTWRHPLSRMEHTNWRRILHGISQACCPPAN